ncbi:MAG: hypothetical protein ACE5PT_10830 [Gemmatimonadales bacterium]
MNDRIPDPLPREWLPEAVAPRGSTDRELWEVRLRRLMRSAEPRLERLGSLGAPWWTLLAAWWKPTLGMAGAAAVILALLVSTVTGGAPAAPEGSPTLAAVAGDGEPAALWIGLGGDADPVLAAIALEGNAP